MATTLQIVNPDDETTVLWDFNGSNTVASGTVTCAFGLGGSFQLNAPETEFVRLASTNPGGRTTARRDPLVESSFRMRATGSSFDALRDGVNELGRLMADGGVIRWKPDGAAEYRYIDFEPSNTPVLFDGEELELPRAINLFDLPRGATILITRQPYLRGPLLDGAANVLTNSMLVIDRGGDGRPDGWTWDNTGNISSESIYALAEAYRFDIATTSTRNLEQTTATGTFAQNDIATFSFYGKVASGTNVRVRAVVRYLDSGGTALGTEQVSSQITLTTSPQRITVTTSAAPASTSKARCSIRFENSSATAATVYLNRAQMEKASAASTFRVCSQPVSVNPNTSNKGRMIPFYNAGSAEAPVRVKIVQDAAGCNGFYYAAAGSGGILGGGYLTDLLNRHHVELNNLTNRPEPIRTVTDSGAASGTGLAANLFRQNVIATGEGTTASASWAQATLPGSLLLIFLAVQYVTAAVTITLQNATDWTVAASQTGGTNDPDVREWKYESSVNAHSGSESATISSSRKWYMQLIEIPLGGTVLSTTPEDFGNYAQRPVRTKNTLSPTVSPALLLGWGTANATDSSWPPSDRGEYYGSNIISYDNTNFGVVFCGAITPSAPASTNAYIGWFRTSAIYYRSTADVISLKADPWDAQVIGEWSTSTKCESLRGSHDLFLRLRPRWPDSTRFRVHWAQGLQGPTTASTPWRSYDARGAYPPHDSGEAYDKWVDFYLGSIGLPTDGTVSGLYLELEAQTTDTSVADDRVDPEHGGLYYGELYIAPGETRATCVLPTPEKETFGPGEISTPVRPSGTAFTVSATKLTSNATTNSCGIPSTKGTNRIGPIRFAFKVFCCDYVYDANHVHYAIRNITDGTDEHTAAWNPPTGYMTNSMNGPMTKVLDDDLAAAHLYGLWLRDPDGATDIEVYEMSMHPLPAGLASGDYIVSDPETPLVRRYNSTGKAMQDFDVHGAVPDYRGPGLNAVYIVPFGAPVAGTSGLCGATTLTDTATVTFLYSPRYYT